MRTRSSTLAGLALAALICLAAPGGASAAPSDRIAGGYYAPSWFLPWTTSIEGSGGRCTASLIAPKRVLTAAHCVEDDLDPRVWTVRVGVRYRNLLSDGQTRGATGIAMHPSYSDPPGPGNYYDLAVIFLRRPATYTPAPLGDTDDWGTWAYATGWGHTNYDHANPITGPILKGITVRLGDDGQCSYWIGATYIPSIQICAYDAEGDDCITHGDSGGPLVVAADGTYKLIGVTSNYPLTDDLDWGQCGRQSMTQFVWLAGPTLRNWPFTVVNPGCAPARTQLRKAKRKKAGKKRIRRAKRNVREACNV